MADGTPKPEPEPGAGVAETPRAAVAITQQVLVATLVGAIILMIAIAAFWTSL
jgi:hypothetical protein